jgi:hypothetical protein
MNDEPAASPNTDETFILAGRTFEGGWQRIETATREEDETADDVRAFLETMAEAHTRDFLDLEIMTEAEFLRRTSPDPGIAA